MPLYYTTVTVFTLQDKKKKVKREHIHIGGFITGLSDTLALKVFPGGKMDKFSVKNWSSGI